MAKASFVHLTPMNNGITLVTGGTGIVGSHLLYRLAQSGNRIRALKRKTSDMTNLRNVFAYYGDPDSKFESIEWVTGDLLDIYSLQDALVGVNRVYHAAALVSFNPADKDLLFEQNIDGTANLVNACLETEVEKLCYVSSTAAIGRSKKVAVVTEETKWDINENTSNYALSKHHAEREVWRGAEEGLKVVIVNPCIVVGPGGWQRSSGTLFGSVRDGLKYYTQGGNAFVDARDVAEVMTSLMESDIDNERFLVIGENMAFRKFFSLVAKALGKKPPEKLAAKWMTALAWRATFIRSKITQKPPVITRESVASANSKTEYANRKIKQALDFTFTPIAEAVENTAGFMKRFVAVEKE